MPPTHLVAAPSALGGVEIEPSGFAEQSDKLETAPCGDHLVQRGVNSGSKGRGPQDFAGFSCDIWINIDRCLRHLNTISGNHWFSYPGAAQLLAEHAAGYCRSVDTDRKAMHLEAECAETFRINDAGKITESWFLYEDQKAYDAFYAEE